MPMSIMASIGRGATHGVLFRDAASIKNLRKVDTLIVDKTGTLTQGRSSCERAIGVDGFNADEALRLAASLDPGSEHPLAAAIVKAARKMTTGDGLSTARAVAQRLGIQEVHGEVKPADKLRLVEQLQAQGRVVGMVGDGINDASALARADVGIAMGTGTDVAMNSAQLTLVSGDLRGIATAITLSVATVTNMKQNLTFAFVYNALGIVLAAGLLFPITGWLLSPMIAALAMSLLIIFISEW